MSQQPPYGPQDPQQPQQPPFTPYSQGAYPNPYAQYPQPQGKNNTTRNVLLIVGAVVILFCGGLFALGVVFFNNIDETFESDYVGSENDPITVEEGEAFEIRGFEYEAGWSISGPAAGGADFDAITGLRATNQRDDEDSERASLTFSLVRDNEVLGEIDCTTGASVRFERAVTLDCFGTDADPGPYDEIEVFDNSYYE